MLPSTRICVSCDCMSSSRIICSVKELENHKTHQTSSLSQISQKLRQKLNQESVNLLNDLKECQQIDIHIKEKCNLMKTMIDQVEEQMVRTIQERAMNPYVIEGSILLVHQNYQNLGDKHLDSLVKLMGSENDLDEYFRRNMNSFVQMQNDFATTLDIYFQTLMKILNNSEHFLNQEQKITSLESKIKEQQNVIASFQALLNNSTLSDASPSLAQEYSTKITNGYRWLAFPDSYSQVTTVALMKDGRQAKHVDGYYTLVLMDKLLSADKLSTVKIRVNKIQEGYVGVGLGLVHRDTVETNGLILSYDTMQTTGHGTYLLFNDKCVYSHHDAEMNGAVKGKDKGFTFQNGDVIQIVFNPKNHRLYFEGPQDKLEIAVQRMDGGYMFAAWLDLSEIEII